ncbi:hypothetical protein NW762_013872 [Fusarium torreyae]|uniref:Secreted protein n=1 Tax=Fusarium torreyae TaxID=1237075 RepID=A0A9W8RMN8_9HYPO|nr:hypothetical protein NW762_013872 [Fusarium torreyae]
MANLVGIHKMFQLASILSIGSSSHASLHSSPNPCLATLIIADDGSGQNTQRSRDKGSFANPPSRDRPRSRYWLPDASVDPKVVEQDILRAGSIGAGGVEFLPFYNYGGGLGPPPPGVDWTKYGFGTPAHLKILNASLDAHAKGGLAMDFALGPNQGQGVPAEPDNEGLQWDLITFSQPVPPKGLFKGKLPGWGTGRLVSAVSGLVLSTKNITETQVGVQGPKRFTYEQLIIRHDTLNDITSKVDSKTGAFSINLHQSPATTRYRVFAFYERKTENKNLVFKSDSNATIWDRGSYAVDHFSKRGAKVITDFWDKYILSDPSIKEKLRSVGNYGWEDSLELRSQVSWSPTLPARFRAKFGYHIRKYLPLIAFGNNNVNIQSDDPGSLHAFLDTNDRGAGFVNDYRAVLAEGYIEYLQTLKQWLRVTLDVSLSVQPAYNLPMDMISVVPYVDVPESESLQAHNNIDAYRTFTGAANLAGRRIISNELGAEFDRAFSLTIPELVQMANRGFAGGLNQFVIHGQSYTGDYPSTTWPGNVPFRYLVSDPYSNKRPDWDHGLNEAIGYIGRVQHVQRQGLPRVDIAVLQKKSVTDPNFATFYEGKDLVAAGWTFNYLSSDNFDLKQAFVRDRILAPEGPSYQALVVPGISNLTLGAVNHLSNYAKRGLPIIISGGTPDYYPNGASSKAQLVKKAISALQKQRNVHSVAEDGVPNLLISLGLKPRVGASFQGKGTLHTTWREDLDNGVSYAYIYSDLDESAGELVPSRRCHYIMSRMARLRFGNQTVIIAFSDKPLGSEAAPKTWFTKVPEGVLGTGYDDRGLYVDAPTHASGVAQLSSGKILKLSSSSPAAFDLSSWTLTAEHWEKPKDMLDASVIAVKRNTTHKLDKLVSWLDIPPLTNTSGIGYYATSFQWGQKSFKNVGAYIELPPRMNSIQLKVNGQQLQRLDSTSPVVDVSKFLVKGKNTIVVLAPTTMWNYLRSIMSQIQNGSPTHLQSAGLAPPVTNGLVGKVRVVPFERVHV